MQGCLSPKRRRVRGVARSHSPLDGAGGWFAGSRESVGDSCCSPALQLCSRPAAPGRQTLRARSRLSMNISPEPARVGPAVVTLLELADAGGRTGRRERTLRVEADMSHAGMAPVFGGCERNRAGPLPGSSQVRDGRRLGYPPACHAARRAEAGTPVRRAGRSTQLGKLLNPSSIPALEAPESLPFDLMRVPGLGRSVSLALCPSAAAGSAAYRQRGDDPARIVRAHAGAEESGDNPELASLSRRAGAGAALRGEFFLPGLPFHAGASGGATLLQAAVRLAAGAAQQVAVGRALRPDPVYSTSCSICGPRPGGRPG